MEQTEVTWPINKLQSNIFKFSNKDLDEFVLNMIYYTFLIGFVDQIWRQKKNPLNKNKQIKEGKQTMLQY